MSDRKAYLDEMKVFKVVKLTGWSLTVPLLFVSVFCFGQPIRFSVFYDVSNGAGGFLSVVHLGNNSMLAVGSSLNLSTNSGNSEGHHVVVEPSGNLLYEHQFSEQQKSHKPQAVIRSSYSDAIYSSGYFCDYTVESPGYCDFYFSRLEETGDTIFTKFIERPDTSDFLLSMVETRPNKIMLIGWTYDDTTNADADLLFITVDTLGNEVNRVVYGGGGTDYAHSGTVINEMGEVLITGGTKSFGGSDYDSWVVKTDSIGNVLWQQTYNHLSPSGGDGGSEIAELQDGNYVIAGAYDNTSLTASWAYLMKIDPDGNEIWTKRYENAVSQGFWACEVLNSGAILAVGQTNNTDDNSQAGWLMKTDANGDTIWTRTYNPSDGTDLLRNMLVMPNGDIVMVGFGRGENSTTQDGWILRVDSMGCEVENCFSVGVEELDKEEHYSIVYPNPASALVQIQSSSLKLQGISVRDVMGREMTSPNPSLPGGEFLQLDVSNWPNGVYLISVTDEHGNNFTQRLVVQH